MKNRLIELLGEGKYKWDVFVNECIEKQGLPPKTFEAFIADHLIANGVIVPPCKVGDTVYTVYLAVFDKSGEEKLYMDIGKAVSLSMQEDGLWLFCRYESGLTYWHKLDNDFGKIVFLTREEAEQALSQIGNKQ